MMPNYRWTWGWWVGWLGSRLGRRLGGWLSDGRSGSVWLYLVGQWVVLLVNLSVCWRVQGRAQVLDHVGVVATKIATTKTPRTKSR